MRPALDAATEGGRLPVVVEASSCAEGLALLVAGAGFEVVDALDFVADRVLPGLTCHAPGRTGRGPSDLLDHGPGQHRRAACGSPHAVADEVTVPVAWGCCGFAGDRGLLHPELTASATAPEAAEVAALPDADAYVSGNRTCEIGMTRATGRTYEHILEVLLRTTAD